LNARRAWLDKLTTSAHPEPVDSPLTLSPPTGERLAQDRLFDSPLALSPSKGERLAQDRPFDLPLALSPSEGERLAQDKPVEGCGRCDQTS